MKKELEKKLIDQFPIFFQDIYGDPRKTCLARGIECENGWFELIKETCEKLSLNAPVDFKFAQIKQKFGSLRIYTNNGNEITNRIIDDAKKESMITCEMCGSKDAIMNKTGYIETLCEKCRNDIQAK